MRRLLLILGLLLTPGVAFAQAQYQPGAIGPGGGTIFGSVTIGPAGGNQITITGGNTPSAAATLVASGAGGIEMPALTVTGTAEVGSLSTPQGFSLTGGSLAAFNGNTFGGAETPYSGFAGTESTFFGDRAGLAFTGAANFNSVFGHNACGDGNSAGAGTGAGTSNACFGTDAGRDINGASSGIALFGAGALLNENGRVSNIAAFGLDAAANENINGVEPVDVTAVGTSACQGASGAAFWGGACLGRSGAALTTASNFLILAGGRGVVGNTTFASGSGVILIGSGAQTVDTPAAGTSNYINIENILTVTGTNTPSTSVTTIAGSLVITTTTGTPASYACFTSGGQIVSSASAC
jgi:hypothetical protein